MGIDVFVTTSHDNPEKSSPFQTKLLAEDSQSRVSPKQVRQRPQTARPHSNIVPGRTKRISHHALLEEELEMKLDRRLGNVVQYCHSKLVHSTSDSREPEQMVGEARAKSFFDNLQRYTMQDSRAAAVRPASARTVRPSSASSSRQKAERNPTAKEDAKTKLFVVQQFNKSPRNSKHAPQVPVEEPKQRGKWMVVKAALRMQKFAFQKGKTRAAPPRPRVALPKSPLDATSMARVNEVLCLPVQRRPVAACAFHPSGGQLATASACGEIAIWCTISWDLMTTLRGHSDWVSCLDFDRNGHYLVSGSSDRFVKVWDAVTWLELKSFPAHTSHLRCTAFSPDSHTFVSGSAESSSNLKVWSVETWEQVGNLIGHDDFVRCCAFKPDGSTLVSGSDDSTLKVWNTRFWNLTRSLAAASSVGGVMSCCFNSSGSCLVSGGEDTTLVVWNTDPWERMHTIEAHTNTILSCRFNLTGNLLVSCSSDKTLRVFDAKSQWRQLTKLEGHTDFVKGCDFSLKGNLIVSVSSDHTIRVWSYLTNVAPPVEEPPPNQGRVRGSVAQKSKPPTGGASAGVGPPGK